MARARSGGVLSPGKAFFLLLVPIVAAGLLALFFVGREAPGPSTNARPAEGLALTDAEAIAKFEELNELRLRALRERDPSLLSLAFTPDSPAAEKVAASIRKLTRDSVFVQPGENIQSVLVTSNRPSEVTVQEVIIYRPRFKSESGKEVTSDPVTERRTVEWTMRLVDTKWLLHDGLIVAAEEIES